MFGANFPWVVVPFRQESLVPHPATSVAGTLGSRGPLASHGSLSDVRPEASPSPPSTGWSTEAHSWGSPGSLLSALPCASSSLELAALTPAARTEAHPTASVCHSARPATWPSCHNTEWHLPTALPSRRRFGDWSMLGTMEQRACLHTQGGNSVKGSETWSKTEAPNQGFLTFSRASTYSLCASVSLSPTS